MTEDEIWKRRFLLFMLVRLSALALVLAGIAVAMTDWVAKGGSPYLGGVIALLGVAELLVVPKLLRRSWESE